MPHFVHTTSSWHFGLLAQTPCFLLATQLSYTSAYPWEEAGLLRAWHNATVAPFRRSYRGCVMKPSASHSAENVFFLHLHSPSSQPNLAASPSSSQTVGASFLLTRSSLIILESFLISSPSTSKRACGSLASSTKWLSQCGQYSSLSSNVSMSLRKTFLHFLQAKIISVAPLSSWSCFSAWHSAQSNHCLQHGERIATWALRMCLLGHLLAYTVPRQSNQLHDLPHVGGSISLCSLLFFAIARFVGVSECCLA
jgi:hypothetical protein